MWNACVKILLIAGLAAGLSINAEEEPEPLKAALAKLPATFKGKPLLIAPKLEKPAKLDADMRDPVWARAAKVKLNELASGNALEPATEARVFCTEDALYIGVTCAEDDLKNMITNGEIWERDSVEVFLEPFHTCFQRPYHQMIMDSGGDTWSRRLHLYPRHDYQSLNDRWDGQWEGVAAKGEQSWSVVLRLPYDQLVLSDEAKGKQTLWRFNLNRRRPARQVGPTPLKVYAWASTGGPHFHEAGKFGYLLPESHASLELVNQVLKESAAVQAEPPKYTADPETLARWRGWAEALTDPRHLPRKRASDSLASTAAQSPELRDAVAELLDNLLRDTSDVEQRVQASLLLTEISGFHDTQREERDDPPEHLRGSRPLSNTRLRLKQ
jgi:hypothetical protein